VALEGCEGWAVPATAPLNASGAAAWRTSALTRSSHSIVARYAGDAATAPSLSVPLTEVVNDPTPIVAMSAMTGGCTGNCTYTITITGSAGSMQVSQKVKLIVKP
jgi:hypothetical protein